MASLSPRILPGPGAAGAPATQELRLPGLCLPGLCLLGLCLLGLFLPGLPAAAQAGDGGGTAPSGQLLVLSYHDVVDTPAEAGGDPWAVTLDHLVAHLEWLRGHGWQGVSLEEVLAARRGGPSLPDRAVLLTFDDGLGSFDSKVLPLLRTYGWPAVLAVVSSWLDVPEGGTVPYGDRPRPRGDFLGWEELRRLDASPLVEVISHSHDLHRGVPGNPQGNLLPAAIAHAWVPEDAHYETEAAYRRRLRRDLETAVRRFREQLGRPPRALAWPYGELTGPAAEVARQAGFELTFSLEEGAEDWEASPPALAAAGAAIPRLVIDDDAGLAEFVSRLRGAGARPPRRSLRVDLSSLHHPDGRVREERLGRLLERARELGVTVAHLEVLHPSRAGAPAGTPYEAFFPTGSLPLRSDLLNRTVWQLRTRLGVRAWAVLPADLPELEAVAGDLARTAPVAGVLFEGVEGAADRGSLHRAADQVRHQRPRARWAAGLDAAGRPPAEIARRVAETVGTADRVVLRLGQPDRLRPEWLEELARSLVDAGVAERVLVELPAEAGAERLVRAMRRLQRSGVPHFGLDGPGSGDTARRRLATALSVETWPYRDGWTGPARGGRD